ncbi:MAG: FTR1 family protein [bacterium]
MLFREALEASIIIAVLLQMLRKMNMQHLRKWVWIGALIGVAISLVFSIVMIIIFYVANTKLFSPQASMIFKGCICYVASILITMVSFYMLNFYGLERKWRRKLEDAFDKDSKAKETKNLKWSMLLLSGSATLREGVEAMLFLTGTSAGLSVKSVIIPGIVGIIVGSLLGVAVYYTGHTIKSLKWFFIVSAALLMFIAAGMVINGTLFFSYAGLFGIMFPYELRPWSNLIVWNAMDCCNPNTNQGWALLRALFGWSAAPTNLSILYYGLYWAVNLPLLAWKAWHGTLTDEKQAQLDDLKSFAKHGLQGDFEDEDEAGDASLESGSKDLLSKATDDSSGGTKNLSQASGSLGSLGSLGSSRSSEDARDGGIVDGGEDAGAGAAATRSSWWDKMVGRLGGLKKQSTL